MEEQGQTEPESERERESKCRRVVDRWASGQLRQVDSLPAPTYRSALTGDAG